MRPIITNQAITLEYENSYESFPELFFKSFRVTEVAHISYTNFKITILTIIKIKTIKNINP